MLCLNCITFQEDLKHVMWYFHYTMFLNLAEHTTCYNSSCWEHNGLRRYEVQSLWRELWKCDLKPCWVINFIPKWALSALFKKHECSLSLYKSLNPEVSAPCHWRLGSVFMSCSCPLASLLQLMRLGCFLIVITWFYYYFFLSNGKV